MTLKRRSNGPIVLSPTDGLHNNAPIAPGPSAPTREPMDGAGKQGSVPTVFGADFFGMSTQMDSTSAATIIRPKPRATIFAPPKNADAIGAMSLTVFRPPIERFTFGTIPTVATGQEMVPSTSIVNPVSFPVIGTPMAPSPESTNESDAIWSQMGELHFAHSDWLERGLVKMMFGLE